MMKHLLLALLFCPLFISAQTQTVGLLQNDFGLDNGYFLFAPMRSNNTYLIDQCGALVHTWTSAQGPALSVYLLPDGSLLRTGLTTNPTFGAGGQGGLVEKLDWNSNVTWSYTLSDATQCLHHDVEALPNGNILVIAWDSKTRAQAVAQGRAPNRTSATVWSEKILELQPTGSSGAAIVWEWHLWDHLIQDFDATKPNYGTVANAPERVNLNFNASPNEQDWIHLNSIDYHAALDQIVVSSHSMSEVWIIDHSTTTAEAASSTGGHSGKGGDLLYRWGNPAAYDQGTANDQQLFAQHDAYWIPTGYPYGDHIMIYNNGLGRPGGNYTTCEIIQPPTTGFTYQAALPYAPAQPAWTYNSGNTEAYYAQNISGAQQMPNGRVLLCNGPEGEFRQVDSTGRMVWQYINPVSSQGILTQGSTPARNLVFRVQFYPDTLPAFTNQTLTSGPSIENSNNLTNACNLLSTPPLAASPTALALFPNPARESVELVLTPSSTGLVQVYNSTGQLVHTDALDHHHQWSVADWPAGLYVVRVHTETQTLAQTLLITP